MPKAKRNATPDIATSLFAAPEVAPPVLAAPPALSSAELPEAAEAPMGMPELPRLGKDEMNLVEHPFAILSKDSPPGAVIQQEWETRHPATGKVVKAVWRVAGDPELGLPTPADERVYLVLMELTREAGFREQTVAFTRYDVVKRLGWPLNQNSYAMLQNAFRRLKGVTITADNAFWDARSKVLRSVGFNILDFYNIADEKPGRKAKPAPGDATQRPLPLSLFKWSDVLFQSFQDGNIRSIDLAFVLSLKRPLSIRLFRYLDKKVFDGRPTFEISLSDLCLHLGMETRGRYASNLKAGLLPAHEELLEHGFLRSVSYSPLKGRKGDKVCYVFPPRAELESPDATAALPAPLPGLGLGLEGLSLLPAAVPQSAAPRVVTPPTDALPSGTSAAVDADELLARITALGVSAPVAHELCEGIAPEALRVQLDCLDDREAKNPAAVFVKAAREMWALPASYVSRVEAQERAQTERMAKETAEQQEAQQRAQKRAQRASQDAEAARLDAAYAKLDERNRARVDEQVTERLGIVGQLRQSQGALSAMRRQVLRELLEQAAAG